MYNPFKPHIVQFANGKYGVRKFCFLFWGYRDKYFNDVYWWTSPTNVAKYSMVETLERAQEVMSFCNSSIRVIKVIK